MAISKTGMQAAGVSLVSSLIGVYVGNKINVAMDNKLAKSEDPGTVNKFMRWNLKVGRSPLWNTVAVVANVASAYYAGAAVEEANKSFATYRQPNAYISDITDGCISGAYATGVVDANDINTDDYTQVKADMFTHIRARISELNAVLEYAFDEEIGIVNTIKAIWAL